MNHGAPVSRVRPLRKSVTVRWSPEAAFRRFTDEIATWWPRRTHSVGGEAAENVIFEPRVGGRIYEVMRGGRTAVWGTVLEFEPPRRVAFSWHPGREPETAQTVEVTFAAAGDGTLVELVHTGWEKLGEEALEMRERYDGGWTFVLDRFGE